MKITMKENSTQQTFTFKEIKKLAKECKPQIYKDIDEIGLFIKVNHLGEIFCIYGVDEKDTTICLAHPYSDFNCARYMIFKGTLEFKLIN